MIRKSEAMRTRPNVSTPRMEVKHTV